MLDKLKRAHENLGLSIALQMEAVEGARIEKHTDYIIYSIGMESTDAHLNGVLCLGDMNATEVNNKAKEFFTASNLAYTIWIREDADSTLESLLQKQGVKPNRPSGSAVMIREKRLEEVGLPKGFNVQEVTNAQHRKDFGEVIEQSFDKTHELIEKMFETQETLQRDKIISHIIYEDKKPVAAVMTVVYDDTAGIYWVGTVTQARGKGLGSYATQIAANAGFNHGANLVILQASELGEPIYKKLGFQTITKYRTYTMNNPPVNN